MNYDEQLAAFRSLYQGSPRSFGRFYPATNSVITEKANHADQHFVQHLRGETGIGLVPVLDDGTCWFGVIDIDCHGDDEPEIDLTALCHGVENASLPLVVLRSKSGGAHVTLFGAEPLPAAVVVQLLTRWAAELGYAGSEIFPKQTRLIGDALGNWINLPYFACRSTNRYAMSRGEQLEFERFLELAQATRVSRSRLAELVGEDHSEAPPCFQRMLAERVPDGFRNEALYHATVYLKRAFPDDWRERAFGFNEQALETPLPQVEAKRSITSAGRRDYKYKCSQEPCKSRCDRTECLTRKFGITPAAIPEGANGMPEMTAIRKYNTDPARYELVADGVTLSLSPDEFMKWGLLRFRLTGALSRVMPEMQQPVFEQQFLNKWLAREETMVVPDEASPAGLIRMRLLEWFKKAKISQSPADRNPRGVAVKCEIDNEPCYIFRGPDFVDHLRRTRSEDLKGPALWMAVKEVGVTSRNVRIDKRPMSLWVAPAALIEEDPREPKSFATEF